MEGRDENAIYGRSRSSRFLAKQTGMAATVRIYGVLEQTLSVWHRRFEGIKVSQVVELKQQQQEHVRLKNRVKEQDMEFEVV